MNTTVTMTLTQLGTIACYLRITATFRQEEREYWERCATKIGKDGKPAFPLASDMAKLCADMERELEEILEIYDNRMAVLREIVARTPPASPLKDPEAIDAAAQRMSAQAVAVAAHEQAVDLEG